MSFNKRILDYLREKQAINIDKVGSLKGVKVAFHTAYFCSSIGTNTYSFKERIQQKLLRLQ